MWPISYRKNDILTEKEIDILKGNYKSLLLIGEKPLKAMKNVVIGMIMELR